MCLHLHRGIILYCTAHTASSTVVWSRYKEGPTLPSKRPRTVFPTCLSAAVTVPISSQAGCLSGAAVGAWHVCKERNVLLHICFSCTSPAPCTQLPAPYTVHPCSSGPAHAPRSLSSPLAQPTAAFPPVPLAQSPLKAKSLGSTNRGRTGSAAAASLHSCISGLGPIPDQDRID